MARARCVLRSAAAEAGLGKHCWCPCRAATSMARVSTMPRAIRCGQAPLTSVPWRAYTPPGCGSLPHRANDLTTLTATPTLNLHALRSSICPSPKPTAIFHARGDVNLTREGYVAFTD